MWTLNTFVLLYLNLRSFLSEETPLELIEICAVEPKNGDRNGFFTLYGIF